ncbi:hypothetical protein [Streptomyces sp. NPDC001435]|uniref:hypothetical protein n=1 Tax=Streptomyces sp. NPDC001435 TaxID=3364576 RepID=UPI0036A47FA0
MSTTPKITDSWEGRDADRALSTYLRRPAWISQPLRAAVKDNWPAGEELAA